MGRRGAREGVRAAHHRTHGAFSGEVLVQLYNVLIFGAQYRLGVFGFLALAELRDEHTEQYTGNYGLFDQQGLLRWMDDNDAAFGDALGDCSV